MGFDEALDALQALAARDPEEAAWPPELNTAFEAAIRAAGRADDLWAVLVTEPFSWAMTTEDQHPPAVIDAILDTSAGWPAGERARALGYVAGCLGNPASLLGARGVNAKLVAVIERRSGELLGDVGSRDPVLRGAAALLLAWRKKPRPADVVSLIDRLDREPEASAGALALATAVAAKRGKVPRDASRRLRERLAALCRAKDPATACLAALGTSLVGRIGGDEVRALARGLRRRPRMPIGWGDVGGRGGQPVDARRAIVARLEHVDVPDGHRDVLIGALAACKVAAGPVLVRLAFDEPTPPAGLALSEMSAGQKAALPGFAAEPVDWRRLRHLGLMVPDDITPFLAGEPPLWRPYDLEVGGERHRWHWGRAWREVLFAGRSVDAVADALVAAMPADDLLLCTVDRMSRGGLPFDVGDVAPLDGAYVRAVIERLHARGVDVASALAPWGRDFDLIGRYEARALGLAVLLAHALADRPVPDDLDEMLGASWRSWKEHGGLPPRLLDRLGARRARAIRASTWKRK